MYALPQVPGSASLVFRIGWWNHVRTFQRSQKPNLRLYWALLDGVCRY
jgi:hypothetical protein